MSNATYERRLSGMIRHTETCGDSWFGRWEATVTILYTVQREFTEDAFYPRFNIDDWHVASVDSVEFFPRQQDGRSIKDPERHYWIPTIETMLDDSTICDECYQHWLNQEGGA